MIRYGLEDLTTQRFGQEPRSLLPANLRRAAKRMLDATVSLALLLLLSPLARPASTSCRSSSTCCAAR